MWVTRLLWLVPLFVNTLYLGEAMEIVKEYNNRSERDRLVIELESQGFTMVSDTFRASPGAGVMVFTNTAVEIVQKSRDLAKEIDDLERRIFQLELKG